MLSIIVLKPAPRRTGTGGEGVDQEPADEATDNTNNSGDGD
jgi:hypothetical protein